MAQDLLKSEWRVGLPKSDRKFLGQDFFAAIEADRDQIIAELRTAIEPLARERAAVAGLSLEPVVP